MRIAIVNETSAADRNADIVAALSGRGHELLNCGMRKCGEAPEISYVHTGLMAALLLGMRTAELVVGGCGTGQGFLCSASQYPGVICGHLLTPLDAWLFGRINAGNCVSLALNQGYGWAGDINLRLLFDELLSGETGSGYPQRRAEPQRAARAQLSGVSDLTHKTLPDIVAALPDEVASPAIGYPGFADLLRNGKKNDALLDAVAARVGR